MRSIRISCTLPRSWRKRTLSLMAVFWEDASLSPLNQGKPHYSRERMVPLSPGTDNSPRLIERLRSQGAGFRLGNLEAKGLQFSEGWP